MGEEDATDAAIVDKGGNSRRAVECPESEGQPQLLVPGLHRMVGREALRHAGKHQLEIPHEIVIAEVSLSV